MGCKHHDTLNSMYSMASTLYLLRVAVFASFAHAIATNLPLPAQRVTRIAFASCNNQDKPQPAWHHIRNANPDVFVWLGDAVYADKPMIWKWRIPANDTVLEHEYAKQRANTNYSEFRAHVPIVGVYDDHDYGINDGDKYWPHRKDAMRRFLDFVDEPERSDRRRQEGVYTSYTFGERPNKVKLILLDVRSNRDPYDLEKEQDMLGPEQWRWLRERLVSDPADVTIIGSGLQVLSRMDPWTGEIWSRLPQSQAKLLSLLVATNATQIFFISGDVHVGEVNAAWSPALGFPVLDFTASGMTHTWSGPVIGPAYRMLMMGSTRTGELIQEHHWGLLEFDWRDADAAATRIRFTLHSALDGRTLLTYDVPLLALQPGTIQAQTLIASIKAQRSTWHDALGALGDPNFPLGYGPGSLMMNGLKPPSHVSKNDAHTRAAMAVCAQAPLDAGFTPECAAVMASFSPYITLADNVYYFVGHGAVLAFIWVSIFFLICGPIFAAVWGGRWRGGRAVWLPLAVALSALIAQLFRKL